MGGGRTCAGVSFLIALIGKVCTWMYLVDLGSQNNDELLPKLFQAASLESGEEASRDSYWSSRCCWPTYSSSSKDSRRGGLFCSIFLALSDHIRSRFNCLKDSKSLSTCIPMQSNCAGLFAQDEIGGESDLWRNYCRYHGGQRKSWESWSDWM